MKINIAIEGCAPEQVQRYSEILTVLISKGALDGVKGGKTILHFDGEGNFMGVQLDYMPWRRRTQR